MEIHYSLFYYLARRSMEMMIYFIDSKTTRHQILYPCCRVSGQ